LPGAGQRAQDLPSGSRVARVAVIAGTTNRAPTMGPVRDSRQAGPAAGAPGMWGCTCRHGGQGMNRSPRI
jgi:hypothetical protein